VPGVAPFALRSAALALLLWIGCAHRHDAGTPDQAASPVDRFAREEAACDSGIARSCYYVGWQLVYGPAERRDEKAAHHRLAWACARQHEKACLTLALMEELALGTPQDLSSALARYLAECTEEGSAACGGAARVEKLIEHYERVDYLVQTDPTAHQAPGPARLPKEEIARTIRAHHEHVRFCYERELRWLHTLEGKVTAQFTIGAAGRVVEANATVSTVPPAMSACILDRIRTWRFLPPEGAGVVTVTFPYIFKPATAASP
jgi:TonB family protein